MRAYIINMDSARKRWRYVSRQFRKTRIPFERVSGVNGRELALPIAEFDQDRYQRYHGKRPSFPEIGCYLSHIKALKQFLASGDQYGLICEDDVTLGEDLALLLTAIIHDRRHSWDLLRLCGMHNGHPQSIGRINRRYHYAVNMTRLSGTGAYLVHRDAAQKLVQRLLPMYLPIDHILDQEWTLGIRSLSVYPLPIVQDDEVFKSQICSPAKTKFPFWKRYWSVVPYRCHVEIHRLWYRTHEIFWRRRTAQTCKPFATPARSFRRA